MNASKKDSFAHPERLVMLHAAKIRIDRRNETVPLLLVRLMPNGKRVEAGNFLPEIVDRPVIHHGMGGLYEAAEEPHAVPVVLEIQLARMEFQ